jgi:heat shock protein HtpX
MNANSESFKVDIEIPPTYYNKLFDFIRNQYYTPQKQRFTDISQEKNQNHIRLTYNIVDQQGKKILRVEITGTDTINAKIIPFGEVTDSAIQEARQDVIIAAELFEEKARNTTWYFAWREGEKIVPEKVVLHEKSFKRLFLETQILLFIVFIVLGMGLFVLIGALYPSLIWVAPIVLIGAQFIFVFYSSKIIARSSDWTITKENPTISFLQFNLPVGSLGTIDEFKQTPPEQIVAIKKETFEQIQTKNGAIDCTQAEKIFNKYNVSCQEGTLTAKKINVYEIVKKVADRFGYKTPKIVVSNTMVPNAAASGPSPSRGVVLITTGLLVQLEEPEILSVIGHEFGHLKGRDPLILFGLTSAEFLFRYYVLLSLFPVIFVSFLFFVYFWAVMTAIFFVAKFFEARADLISAIIMGQPKVLARALEKIGFHRLLFERSPSFRLQEWLGLDSHPPIYFRVERLDNLKEPIKIKHPLITSVREIFKGLAKSI